MTFYLKYRPQTLDQLDLESVRQQLKIILSSGLPHAFLFSGPKGLGKTSAARIVAKAVNCELKTKDKRPKAKDQIEPCNKCEICRSVTEGTALDLIEIDAASTRGIDDIRLLRERIKLAPSRFSYKVYVIDEVHMLTTEAFNALLKTLEEPPEHAVFVLATTEPQKLPATVISRCLHIKFKRATLAEIVRSLKRIVKGEKLEVDEEALRLIAKAADGSFRDAAKILEQLSFSGRKITLKQAKSLIDQSGKFSLLKWLELLFKKDTKQCILVFEQAVEEGIDLKWLVEQSLTKLRGLLLEKYGIVGDERLEIRNWTHLPDKQELEIKDLIFLMELLNRAGVDLKNSIIPQLPIELAIIKWSNRKTKNKIPKIKNTYRKLKNNNFGRARESFDPGSELNSIQDRGKKERVGEYSIEDIAKNWQEVLRKIRPHNHSVEALLRSTRPLKVEGNDLAIEVFYEFHKERLETEKCSQLVEKVLRDLFGQAFRLKYVLGKGKKAIEKQRQEKEIDLVKVAEEIFLKE